MARGDYVKTTFVNGTAPPIDATYLNRLETKVSGMDLIQATQTPLNSGLICAPLASVPEWPDGAYDYFYNDFASGVVDGWATMGTDTVVTGATGELVLTVGAAPTTFVRANKAQAASSRSVRIKWRCAQTDLTTLEIGTSGAGTHVTKSIAGLTSGITDILVGASFTDIEVIFNSTTNNANPVYIDWIEIYNPAVAYSSLALDGSGSGNHATVYGATPVDTVAGRGFSFDGVNDYLSLDINKNNFTGAFAYTAFVQGKARTTNQYLFARGAASAGNRSIRIVITSANLAYMDVSVDGTTAAVIVQASAGTEITSDCLLTFVFIPSTAMRIYKNGVLIKENTTSIPSMAYWNNTLSVEIGRLGTISYLDGWIADPRIYNRALTAEEVWELYAKPGMSRLPGPVIASVSGAPHSLVARDANGLHNTLKMASGAGIDFSANASAAGMTSEVLNDYEEGTWTPTIYGGTDAGVYAVAVTATSCKYVKVGNLVIVKGTFIVTVTTPGTGIMYIGGLPVTKSASQSFNGNIDISGVDIDADTVQISLRTSSVSGTSAIALAVQLKDNSAPVVLPVTALASTDEIRVDFSYFTN